MVGDAWPPPDRRGYPAVEGMATDYKNTATEKHVVNIDTQCSVNNKPADKRRGGSESRDVGEDAND